MQAQLKQLNFKLTKCRQSLNKGYTNPKDSDLCWLNNYCAEFLDFSNDLQKFIANEFDKTQLDGNEQVESIFLCLTQIVTCIRHLESTIKAEHGSGAILMAAREHFLERMNWCVKRLREALNVLAANQTNENINNTINTKKHSLEDSSYVELMDIVLDQLAPYSTFKDENESEAERRFNEINDIKEAMSASTQIRAIVDIILSHTLAFANVALKDDKKALSALCQKVLRECMSLQDECKLNVQSTKCNRSNRKLKAMSLENALYQLEDYLNESLLRLVFRCFLDYERFSIDKLRIMMKMCAHKEEDPALDELIADFDVNIDRTTQIGIFAIAFAPNLKMKTIVRSCLASFESLDTCIIPALQTNTKHNLFAEILEEHYNEELKSFKQVVQEIVDSFAFVTCYQEMLNQALQSTDFMKDMQKLSELIDMGNIIVEHFNLAVNRKELNKRSPACLEQYQKFEMMLQECQAILMCAEQVSPQRICKRFKILRVVLRKFAETLNDCDAGKSSQYKQNAQQIFILSDELNDSQRMFESIGISPSIRSILYRQQQNTRERQVMRQRAASDSLKANYSKLALTPPQLNVQSKVKPLAAAPVSCLLKENRASIRRKTSLRTAMFKSQKSKESDEVYKIYKNHSSSLHISEILDQLSGLSSHLSTITQPNDSLILN